METEDVINVGFFINSKKVRRERTVLFRKISRDKSCYRGLSLDQLEVVHSMFSVGCSWFNLLILHRISLLSGKQPISAVLDLDEVTSQICFSPCQLKLKLHIFSKFPLCFTCHAFNVDVQHCPQWFMALLQNMPAVIPANISTLMQMQKMLHKLWTKM